MRDQLDKNVKTKGLKRQKKKKKNYGQKTDNSAKVKGCNLDFNLTLLSY